MKIVRDEFSEITLLETRDTLIATLSLMPSTKLSRTYFLKPLAPTLSVYVLGKRNSTV